MGNVLNNQFFICRKRDSYDNGDVSDVSASAAKVRNSKIPYHNRVSGAVTICGLYNM
jgi:hypothetical protein